MSRKRIYEWMLHYRNVAERKKFRITRWKLTDEQARQLSHECTGGRFPSIAAPNYERLKAGCTIMGIPVVIKP